MSKRVRNQILALAVNLGLLAFATSSVYAWDITDPFAALSENPCILIQNIANMLISFVVVAGVIFLAMGGIQYMSSGGDKVAVEAAKGKVTGAVTGLLIGFGGYFIIRVLMSIAAGTVPACKPQIV